MSAVAITDHLCPACLQTHRVEEPALPPNLAGTAASAEGGVLSREWDAVMQSVRRVLGAEVGDDIVATARALTADRDRLAALLREAQSYLLADEERRKLTGDALHAEGELARAHAQLERLDTAEGVIAILRRVGSLTPALERCVYQHYVNHALDEAQRTVRPQVEAERAAEGAAPAPGPAAQANRGEVTWKR